jgi:uncharacterized protein (UPF0248 family)
MNNNSTPEVIEKEIIADLKFPDKEVLGSSEEIKNRKSELERAMSLGNLERNKIKIYFEDDKGFKVVETTVWGLTDKRVILKQGMVIPIHRVREVKI